MRCPEKNPTPPGVDAGVVRVPCPKVARACGMRGRQIPHLGSTMCPAVVLPAVTAPADRLSAPEIATPGHGTNCPESESEPIAGLLSACGQTVGGMAVLARPRPINWA